MNPLVYAIPLLLTVGFLAGWYLRGQQESGHYRITDFRQRRRIALRRAAKRFNA